MSTLANHTVDGAEWRALGAPTDFLLELERIGGYAAMLRQPDRLDYWQDALDNAIGARIIDVRNALRDRGWEGIKYGSLITTVADVTCRYDPTFVKSSQGCNVVGMSHAIALIYTSATQHHHIRLPGTLDLMTQPAGAVAGAIMQSTKLFTRDLAAVVQSHYNTPRTFNQAHLLGYMDAVESMIIAYPQQAPGVLHAIALNAMAARHDERKGMLPLPYVRDIYKPAFEAVHNAFPDASAVALDGAYDMGCRDALVCVIAQAQSARLDAAQTHTAVTSALDAIANNTPDFDNGLTVEPARTYFGPTGL